MTLVDQTLMTGPAELDNKQSILTYFLTQVSGTRSFDPMDSDSEENGIHMRHLVGTLLKYNSTSSYIPYLAEKWSVSSDRKIWTFTLRQGLTCEDNTEINSANYVEGLQLAFRNHAPEANTPAFSKLKGWKNFLERKEKTIIGLSSPDSSTVVFQFEKAPDGLEVYLAMPYFGFFCKGNFDPFGKWLSKDRIVSSGPYKLNALDERENLIRLEKRPEWKGSSIESGPKFVDIRVATGIDLNQQPRKHSIVRSTVDEKTKFHPDWALIRGAVTVSSNLILNPQRPFFSKLENRKAISNVLRSFISDSKKDFKWTVISTLFYPYSFPNDKEFFVENKTAQLPIKLDQAIVVEEFPLINQRASMVEKLLTDTFKKVGLPIVRDSLSGKSLSDNDYFKFRDSSLDVFFINVDKGGTAEPWLNRMMFCSKLGVQFPDPSGRVCELTTRYENRILTADERFTYGIEFEKILAEDSVVIPILHKGKNWLHSNDIDVSGLSPNMGNIDFTSINLK